MYIDETGDIYNVGNSQTGNIDGMCLFGINDYVAFSAPLVDP